jgi:cell wall-associated NlpC family hydrolase
MNIDKVIEFAKTLLDIPYIWWTGNETEEDDMFYCNSIPSIDTMKIKGINCAGFINLLMLFSGKTIPQSKEPDIPRGGTGFWFIEFTYTNVLYKKDHTKIYPNGTLLFRSYKNIEDQGHLAVVIGENKIIHSYAEEELGKVGITDMVNSYAPLDYYEYIVYPTDWLHI